MKFEKTKDRNGERERAVAQSRALCGMGLFYIITKLLPGKLQRDRVRVIYVKVLRDLVEPSHKE